MRKHVLFLVAAGLSGSFIFFNSCKKELSPSSSSNKETIEKVNTWLDEQKAGKSPSGVSNIELLKNSLDFASLRFEKSEDGEKLLIVPVEKSLKSITGMTTNSIPNLVLIIDKLQNIRKGYIVLYTTDNGLANKIPDNTFYHIFNTAEPECNGKFRFLNIMGRVLYQLEYKDKWLQSVGLVKPKKNPGTTNNPGGRTQAGYYIDWYLVTTLYYVDGTSELVSETYLYTTYVSDPDNPDTWPVDGGNAVDYEYEMEKLTPWWHVYDFPGNLYSVQSYEILKGKRVSTDPYGGHFTSAKHGTDGCNNPDGVWLANYNQDVNFSSWTAYARITGTWTFNGTNTPIEGFHSWSYQEMFP